MKIKVCERCQGKIRPKVESYFEVITFEKGKEVKRGFMHKQCNDEAQKQRETITKSFETLGKVTEKLNSMIPQEKVYEIK